MSNEQRRSSASPARSSNRTLLIAVAGVVAVVALTMAGGLFVFARQQPLPKATPAPTLLGEEIPMRPATHVGTAAELDIPSGQPPTGGPHYPFPEAPGIFDKPVDDGKAIHSLEHGLIWISYRPDLITPADLEVLRTVQRAHPKDVLLSPRPGNTAPASIVSWGRRLNLTLPVSAQTLESFVVTNLNKSPEPGVR